MKRKDFEAPALSQQREYAPQRWPSVASDVSVPLLQSMVTGLLVAIFITGLVWGTLGNALADTLNISTARGAASTFATVFSLGVIFAWFWRLGVVTETLWAVEEAIGHDITGDNIVGRPQPKPTVRLEITQGHRQDLIDIEGLEDLQRLRQFAIMGLTDRFRERKMTKAFGWSQTRWQEVRANMVNNGWIEWNGEEGSTQSVSLLPYGETILREVLEQTTT